MRLLMRHDTSRLKFTDDIVFAFGLERRLRRAAPKMQADARCDAAILLIRYAC